MKPETTDITSQSNTQEKSSDEKVLNIDYFYDLYLKKHKRKKSISFSQYKLIISTYLRVFFKDLYLKNFISYFFLSGKIKIVTNSPWTNVQRRGNNKTAELHKTGKSLGLFWYLRPNQKIHNTIKLKKMTGKRNAIPMIEKIFNENYDKDLLPIFTIEQKKGKTNKTLFKCIQT